MYTIEHPCFRLSTGRSVIDPRTWRVVISIGNDSLLARYVVDDFGDLVRVSEWLS